MNGKALSENINLSAADVNALAATGTAAAATKLATGRTIRTNLASTSASTFDGSGNITPGVSGILPIANGGTGASTAAAALAALGGQNRVVFKELNKYNLSVKMTGSRVQIPDFTISPTSRGLIIFHISLAQTESTPSDIFDTVTATLWSGTGGIPYADSSQVIHQNATSSTSSIVMATTSGYSNLGLYITADSVYSVRHVYCTQINF